MTILKRDLIYEIKSLKKFINRRLNELEFDSTQFDAEFILKHIKNTFFTEVD